jgi:minor extracellular serine protease Vpr
MKKWIILLLLSMCVITSVSAHEFELPPLKLDQSEEIVVIIETKDEMDVATLKENLKKYDTLRLRFTFTEVLNGFSIKGSRKELQNFVDQNETASITTTSEAREYKISGEGSIPFVGAIRARGYFDEQGRRLTGKGVKVGIIDTGMDYHHRDLSINYKGGKDFIDKDDEPMETGTRNHYSTIHGTHVAGVIGANGSLQGMAPGADLYIYRALGPGGRGTTDQVVAAIEQAVKDKVDIVNLSLGSDINGPDLPLSKALDYIARKGIIPVTASGNSGPKAWTIGAPGTSKKSISVGASTPPMDIPYLVVNNEKKPIDLYPIKGVKQQKMHQGMLIEDGGIGKVEELAKVRGKIALIKRGVLTFEEKIKHAMDAGAKGVLIYNNTDGPFMGVVEETFQIPAYTMTKKAGNKLIEKIKDQTTKVEIQFKEEKDRLAPFSSKGPVTVNWLIKPDVTAPGMGINSTIPGGYLALQGTSMAAPHVAGAAAILKQANPNWGPEEIKSALMLSAKPLYKSKGKPYKVYEQGAGRIQLEEALKLETLVTPASISLGQVKGSSNDFLEKKLRIQNNGKHPKKYSLKVDNTNKKDLRWELPLSFTLQPGESKEIIVRAILKTQLKDEMLIDGHLILMENSKPYSIPYLFAVGEPNYPRVMGFVAVPGDSNRTMRYQVYLPGGAEEFGVALFDSETLKFIALVDQKRNVGRGYIENEVNLPYKRKSSIYAVAFARKKGAEDYQKTLIKVK